MQSIHLMNGTFPISRFGMGPAILKPSSIPLGDGNFLHFCCYDPLPVGASGTLHDGGGESIRIKVIERFGDFYNAEVVEGDLPE
ncbi:MAG: hypothetical protein ACR2OZ_00560 [Verrucomicrobiales bacterium]